MNETVMQEPEVRTEFNASRQAAELIPVGGAGVELQNFAQQVDYAKWIAAAGLMIPKHLRGNVGACLAVLDMSQRWGFSPFQVARMTYEVNGNIGLQAQLVHAVLNKFAPLQHRLRIEFEGEGDDRVCIVTGRFRGEVTDCEYRSPRFADIQPKNSPLWKTDKDQQQAYLSVTRWSRRYSPGTLMGLFTKEELEDAGAQFIGPDQAKDITPDPSASLHERLKAAGKGEDGFRDGVVEAGLNGHAPVAPDAPATEQDSSSASSQPPVQDAETKPAPEQVSASGAGATTSSADGASRYTLADEPKQDGDGGDPAVANVPVLPAGLRPDWATAYAVALGRAVKIGQLHNLRQAFFEPLGGLDKLKGTPHHETAEKIYSAFRDHFGEAKRAEREAELRKLGVL